MVKWQSQRQLDSGKAVLWIQEQGHFTRKNYQVAPEETTLDNQAPWDWQNQDLLVVLNVRLHGFKAEAGQREGACLC